MKPHRTVSALLIALALSAGPSAPLLSAQDSPETPKEAPVAAVSTNAPAAAVIDQSNPDTASPKKPKERPQRRAHSDDAVVAIGQGEHVSEGKTVSDLVVVMGSGSSEGTVEDNAVVIGGRLVINGKVKGDAVNVGLGIELGPKADVGGNVVGIGGGVFRKPGAIVHGKVIPIGLSLLPGFKDGIPEWIGRYLNDCIGQLRPLSFTVLAPWKVMMALFLLHFLVAALLPGASQGVERSISERPGSTVLMAVLAIPLVLFVLVLMLVTVVGPVVVGAAILVGILIGKVAILQHLGGRLAGSFGAGRPVTLVCFLIGAVLAILLYCTPFIGLFVWFALSLWGLGAVLLTLFSREGTKKAVSRSGNPSRPVDVSLAAEMPFEPVLAASTPSSMPFAQPEPAPATGSPGQAFTSTENPPSIPRSSAAEWARTASMPGIDASEIETLPRPTFLPRFGALFLDWILVGIVMGMLPDRLFLVNVESVTGPLRLLLGVAYFASMIAWRGTTLGGLLFRLQVIRLDGRPLDRATAIVRAVGAILSGAICGLGWFWALWDEDKQGWHDKFAGTVVVQVQKSKPLI